MKSFKTKVKGIGKPTYETALDQASKYFGVSLEETTELIRKYVIGMSSDFEIINGETYQVYGFHR